MRAYQDVQEVGGDALVPSSPSTENGTPIGILMDGTKGARITAVAPAGRILEGFTPYFWIWNPALGMWGEMPGLSETVTALYDSRAKCMDVRYEAGNGCRLYVTIIATLSGTADVPGEANMVTVRLEADDPAVNP
jgi:hypothetical protein